MTPTARTLQHLRKNGILAGVTERWNQFARIRQDLLGFIDLIALSDRIIAIQATSDQTGGNGPKRVRKILEERTMEAKRWLDAGGRIQVWAWKKYAKGPTRWRPKVTEIELRDGALESRQLGETT